MQKTQVEILRGIKQLPPGMKGYIDGYVSDGGVPKAIVIVKGYFYHISIEHLRVIEPTSGHLPPQP
jgi:hypothetical protein